MPSIATDTATSLFDSACVLTVAAIAPTLAPCAV